MSEVKKTPLCEEHEKLGARMVEFAGWYMPITYSNLKEEHQCVREKVGLFDVSHMGEIFFRGEKALESLEWMTTNHVGKLENGEAQYSLIPNENGGIVDDIIVYCIEKNKEYLVCVNAANIEKDFAWFQKHNKGADITNDSANWGQIAIQGKNAMALMEKIFGPEVNAISSFCFQKLNFNGAECIFARTGYTGEDGGEVFIASDKAAELWRELLEKGKDLGVQAIGLGARDTLRTEMKYSLYGHEIDDTTNPYAAVLGWTVKANDKEFLGKEIILAEKEKGLKHKLIGLELLDKGIARDGYKVFSFDNEEVGVVTSGTMSPSLDKAIAIAYVPKELSEVGTELYVDIRNRKAKAVVCKTPFVK